MARAEIKLPSGAVVVVEGTPDEVDRVLSVYSGTRPAVRSNDRTGKARKGRPRVMAGPMALIRELKESRFFDERQTLKSVLEKLAEGGHIYSDASVGKALQRLTRARELGRIRESGTWKYVKR